MRAPRYSRARMWWCRRGGRGEGKEGAHGISSRSTTDTRRPVLPRKAVPAPTSDLDTLSPPVPPPAARARVEPPPITAGAAAACFAATAASGIEAEASRAICCGEASPARSRSTTEPRRRWRALRAGPTRRPVGEARPPSPTPPRRAGANCEPPAASALSTVAVARVALSYWLIFARHWSREKAAMLAVRRLGTTAQPFWGGTPIGREQQ
eukprot:COSAG01_NODE_7416_length_3217_cov_1.389994_6_plen_210_part_00